MALGLVRIPRQAEKSTVCRMRKCVAFFSSSWPLLSARGFLEKIKTFFCCCH